METLSVAFLIQAVSKKVIDLLVDRVAPSLPKGRDALHYLLRVHRELGTLLAILHQIELEIQTGGIESVNPDIPRSKSTQEEDFKHLPTGAARYALAELVTSLEHLSPTLDVFGPEIEAAVAGVIEQDSAAITLFEEGFQMSDLARVRETVTQAKAVVGSFLRANYSIKDVAL